MKNRLVFGAFPPLISLILNNFIKFLGNFLLVSQIIFIFAVDSVSPQGQWVFLLVKGRLRTLSSAAESRKF